MMWPNSKYMEEHKVSARELLDDRKVQKEITTAEIAADLAAKKDKQDEAEESEGEDSDKEEPSGSKDEGDKRDDRPALVFRRGEATQRQGRLRWSFRAIWERTRQPGGLCVC